MPNEPHPPIPFPPRLSDEAIDWVVRLRSGRATAEDHAAFAAWRRRSPAHAAAAAQAEMLWRDIGAVGARPERTRTLGRRAVLGGAVAASAAALAVGSGVVGPLAGLYADHATRVGERREVRLPDGSLAALNTATALSVAFSAGERRVVLHEGEAQFEVVRDAARPFVVRADGSEVQALGTVFSVRNTGGAVEVVVSEGSVEVRGGVHAVRLVADERVAFGMGGEPGAPERVDARTETAWRRGKLIFNRRPLGDVVAEMQRYRPGRIAVVDDRLRALEVSGIFDLGDADGLLRTVEQTMAARVVRMPLLTVIY
ncbi:FecR family protein [Azospirillum sp.]|uniref:FecR family protein n=1 Tax=Azospirillum sp. TaxID=34012 RepID=UPI003D709DCB